MDIYFCGSIRGGRDDADLYADIIELLEEHGEVLSEHVGDAAVEEQGEKDMTEPEIHARDLEWLRTADVVVAEVTTPSLGVGYEIARAAEWDKPILCLFRPDADQSLSAMVRGSPDVVLTEYTDTDELEPVFERFLQEQ